MLRERVGRITDLLNLVQYATGIAGDELEPSPRLNAGEHGLVKHASSTVLAACDVVQNLEGRTAGQVEIDVAIRAFADGWKDEGAVPTLELSGSVLGELRRRTRDPRYIVCGLSRDDLAGALRVIDLLH